VSEVIVYVDGFNLYYGCLKRTPYKWLDLGALCKTMLPNDRVIAINYYTARISARPGNPSGPTDQQIYLRALRTVPNLSITYGHFLTHSVSMRLTGVTPSKRVWVDKTEEKGSDVNLASHLVRDACKRGFQTAVIMTNDSDLAEPVRIVRHELNLPIGILNPHQQHSTELKRVATFLKRIRQSDLIASQFPDVLADSRARSGSRHHGS
jgi:NYN domain